MKAQNRSKIIYVVFVLFTCFTSCKDNQADTVIVKKTENKKVDTLTNIQIKEEEEVIKEEEKKLEFSCEKCMKVLDSLVRNSSFDKNFKRDFSQKYLINVDEATKNKVIIKVVLGENDDLPLSWLELDLNENKLYDTTKDDLNPELIKINKEILKEFKINCLKCCLD